MKLQDIIEGMIIIALHAEDKYCVSAEHDQIWCGSSDLPLTEGEKDRMEELGWFESGEGWSCYP